MAYRMAYRCVLFFVFALLSVKLSQAQPPQATDEVRRAIVKVTSYDERGNVFAHCWGLFVSDAGDVVTTTEALPQGGGHTEITTSDNKTYPVIHVASSKTAAGLAWLRVDMPASTAHAARIGKATPANGEHLFILSGDSPARAVAQEIIVGDTRKSDLGQVIEVSDKRFKATAGSPVVDQQGEVIGMVRSGEKGAQEIIAFAGEHLIEIAAADENGQAQGAQAQAGATPIGKPIGGEAIVQVQPKYSMAGQNVGGTVVVEVTIDEAGNVILGRAIKLTIQKPRMMTEADARRYGEELKKAALDAAMQWKFKPIMVNGVAVKATGNITFTFHH
jgi:hypothetical protein